MVSKKALISFILSLSIIPLFFLGAALDNVGIVDNLQIIVVFILAPLFGIAAIILGIFAILNIKHNPKLKGKGLAITGIVLGIIDILLLGLMFLSLGAVS